MRGCIRRGASSPPGILLDCNEGSQSCIHSAVIQKCVSASRPILIVPSARAYMAYWLGWHDQKTYRIGKKKKEEGNLAQGDARVFWRTQCGPEPFSFSLFGCCSWWSHPCEKKRREKRSAGQLSKSILRDAVASAHRKGHSFVWDLVAEEEEEKTDRCQVGGKGVKEAPNWAWNAVRQHRVFWVMDSTLRPVSWRNVSRQLASSAPPSAPVAWRLPVFQQLVIHCLLLASKAHVMGCQLVQSTIDAPSKITFLSFLPIVGKNCWAY